MPLVSGAIAAVSLAATITTAATVGAAIVSVSTLIATVGLAVTAVGMVTGNKDLLMAGKIMGFVGLAGGIAGLGVGAFGSATSAATSVGNQFANPQLAASITGDIGQAGKVGAGSVLAPATANNAAQVGAGSVLAPTTGTGMINAASGAQGIPGQAAAGIVPPGASGGPPIAGVTPPPAPVGSQAGTIEPLVSSSGQVVSQLSGTQGSDSDPSKVKDWYDKLPDWAKAQLATTGAQGAPGPPLRYL